jgi:hypothetical protein
MTIWDRYPNLSDGELRNLVATTARVMLDADGVQANVSNDLLNTSNLSASRELAALLPGAQAGQAGDILNILEDEDLSREVACAVLDEVRKQPELAQMVADAYEERAQKMVVPELVLLTGALVILAIKIDTIQWNKKGVKIKFYESGEAVKTFLSGLLKSGV